MNKFTFLTMDQINKLKIFKIYGTKCAITDFAILLGGYVDDFYIDDNKNLNGRTGEWWTKTSFYADVQIVNYMGGVEPAFPKVRGIGARPAVSYSSIELSATNEEIIDNGCSKVECFEYPKWIGDETFSCKLEEAYSMDVLNTTGKTYTTDSVGIRKCFDKFIAREFIEYEYDGNKYIRFVADENCNGKLLSDGRIVQIGESYWVKVEPIIWLVDKQADIALANEILFAGVQFYFSSYSMGNFGDTTIKLYMNRCFSTDIIPSKICKNSLEKKKKYN